MSTHTFDDLTRSLTRSRSRRAVVGGADAAALASAGIGVASATPSTRATCMKAATAAAKTCRSAIVGLRGKEKRAALTACQDTFKASRALCVGSADDDDDTDDETGGNTGTGTGS